ncbi:hypothetical protein M413DRAFT_23015 [Hebeloma cylindrosporum]|uniref:Uncharacterized protein n=1 Tax=Hebeloma cylindrosporum TaxID=76867 RepID=A0A0C2Z0C8_HEBCY|nr:hypothetical protein M413DRAFT_23015 [Hebeloma cylindrosporum h7]
MFSFGERLGMLFPVMGACLSLVSVSFILLLAVSRWIRRTVFSRGKKLHSGDISDNSIFLNLMVADLILALGDLPIIKWMADAVITEGPLCTAQAVIKQIGGDGVALSSLAIAVYTFCVLVFRWNIPRYISKLVILMIWVAIALIVAIPYIVHMKERERIYGDVGYWCWVRPKFKGLQLATEYIWLWGSLMVLAILYSIMFFVMRGWFIVDNGVWYWHKNYIPRDDPGQLVEETQEEKESKAIANMLLLYPVVYLISILPYSIARWRYFSGFDVEYQFTLVVSTFFSLSGLFNAILFFRTRPDLVTGHEDTPPLAPGIDLQMQPFHDKELISLKSQNFGTFPTRSPAASNYASVEGANTNLRASPGLMESQLGSHRHCVQGSRINGDLRSIPASPTMEEETYGHLPV